MNRTTLSLIATVTALAAVTGVAALQQPSDEPSGKAPAAARLPVERSTLLCPPPSSSDLARTAYTALTPELESERGVDQEGAAEMLPAPRVTDGGVGAEDEQDPKDAEADKDADKGDADKGDADKDADKGDADKGESEEQAAEQPALALKQPGTPAVADAKGADAPGLAGSADGRFAPGWTVQQTTVVTVGSGRGVLGTGCSAPDTDFWFPGTSTAEDRQDYVYLTNPDRTPAVVDLSLHGKDGAVDSEVGENIAVPGRTSVPVLLSTLAGEPMADAALHVKVRTGRVGAQVQVIDDKLGSDWLQSAAEPATAVVLPGIPADATSVRMMIYAPGDRDADLAVRLAGPSGTITPAGAETVHVKSGTVTAVELDGLTQGEAGSLVLRPTGEGGEPAPVVAALRVTRGKDSKQEIAFIPATAPIVERATVADNRAKGSTLSLVAPDKSVEVKVTASAGSGGGTTVSKNHKVEGGTTLDLEQLVPSGLKGRYGLTVERISGGTLYAARTLELPAEGIPMFTVQTLPDDRSMVQVPAAEQDLSVLMD